MVSEGGRSHMKAFRSCQMLPRNRLLQLFFRLLTSSYLLFVFEEFSHTPLQRSLAESCWSGSPERRQTYCSYMPIFPRQQNWHPTIKQGAVCVWWLAVSIQEGLRKTSCYYRHVGGCGHWIAFFKAKIRGRETRAIRVFIKSSVFSLKKEQLFSGEK